MRTPVEEKPIIMWFAAVIASLLMDLDVRAQQSCDQDILVVRKHAETQPVNSGYFNAVLAAEKNVALGKTPEASKYFQQSLQHASTPDEAISALNSIGNCEFKLLRSQNAINYYDKAFQILAENKSNTIAPKLGWYKVLAVNKAAALIEENKVQEASSLLKEIECSKEKDNADSATVINKQRLSIDVNGQFNEKSYYSWSRASFNTKKEKSASLSWKSDPREVIIHLIAPEVLQRAVIELLECDNFSDAGLMLENHARDLESLYGIDNREAETSRKIASLIGESSDYDRYGRQKRVKADKKAILRQVKSMLPSLLTIAKR